ncbi:MAG: efflux RND transporter permease subunit [Pirellulaceae bacterium]
MVYIIGFSDSVHLVHGFQSACNEGLSRRDAIVSMIKTVGPACALTSLTTGVAFLSFFLAELVPIKRFGMTCALGTLLTYVSVMVIVPMLLLTPLSTRIVPNRQQSMCIDSNKPSIVERLVETLLNYSSWVFGLAVIFSALLIWQSAKLHADIRWTESLPINSETREVVDACDNTFGGSLPIHVVMTWPIEKTIRSQEPYRVLAEVHDLLNREEKIHEPFSIGNIANGIYKGNSWLDEFLRLPQYIQSRVIRPDLRKMLITAKVPDAGAAAMEPTFLSIEHELKNFERRYPGYKFELTGTAVVAARNVRLMIHDLAKSLAATAIVVFIIMTLAFRSFRLGMISVIPNAFPLLFAAGMISLSGKPLQIVAVLTFSISLGIAVDDTIHFMSRYQQLKKTGLTRRQSVTQTTCQIGSILIVTSLVLVGGFVVMTISNLPPLRTFGGLSSVALLAALLADLTVLPAALVLFDRGTRNEMAPHSSRKKPSHETDVSG